MSVKAYKIKAIIKKDIKNIFKNPNMWFVMLAPVGIQLFLKFMLGDTVGIIEEHDNYYLVNLATMYNVALIPISVVATAIAEEKEKNTLRTLFLSNVSATEFMLSKVILGIILMVSSNIIIFIVGELSFSGFPWYIFITTITSISALFFGALIGVYAKDQISVGYYSMPIMILMIVPSFSYTDSMRVFAKFIPTNALNEYLAISSINDLFNEKGLFTLGVILIWTIISAILFKIIYKRTSFDN